MLTEKPIFVHHDGRWRPYRAGRALLMRTSIGDVIPVIPEPLCDAPAITYLHTRPEGGADVVSIEALRAEEWQLVPILLQQPVDSFGYVDPFEDESTSRSRSTRPA